MNYYIQLPNNEYVEVPQGVSEDEARARIMRDPRFRPVIEQAISEQSSMLPDLAGSFVRGVGALPTAVGTLTGLVPGMQDNVVSRGLVSAGEYLSQRGNTMMSPGGRMQQELFQAVMDEADKQGLVEQAKVALREAISNPRMLANITAESIPSLVGSFGGGFAVRGAASVGSRLAGRPLGAEGLRRAGVAGAIGTESLLEGGGSAADVYKEIKGLKEEELQKSPEYQELLRGGLKPEDARESLARSAARQAAAQTAAISGTIGAALPGVETMPFAKVSTATRVRRALTGAGTEAAQEAGQEGGGALSENIARQRAEIDRELTAGVGSRATLGALVGGITGGAFGGLRSSAPDVDRTEDAELRNALQAGQPEFQRAAIVERGLNIQAEDFLSRPAEEQEKLFASAQEALRPAPSIRQISPEDFSAAAQGLRSGENQEAALGTLASQYIADQIKDKPSYTVSVPSLQAYLSGIAGRQIPMGEVKAALDRQIQSAENQSGEFGFSLGKGESKKGKIKKYVANNLSSQSPEIANERIAAVEEGRVETPMGAPSEAPEGPGFALPLDVKQILQDLRKGVKPQQQSLVQFLRKVGGLNDTDYMAGEVFNILGSNKALPGPINNQPRTPIKNQYGKTVGFKGGLTLDRAREKLVEEGFLPEDADINDMLNAIREELSGGGVNFGLTEDYEGQERQRAAQQLERALDEAGVTARDSDEDIARALGFEVPSAPVTESDVEALDQARFANAPAKPLGPAEEYSARNQPGQATQPEQATKPSPAFDFMAVINDRLNKIRAKGKQGEAIATAIERDMKSGKFQPEQIYAAFKAGEVMAAILPAGANHEIRFVERILKNDIEAQGRRLAPIDTAASGIIEISLSDSVLSMAQETASHEAFHVLQDYYGQYDPAFKKLMGQSFKDNMTLDQVDSTIKRKLQTIRMPGSKDSYWDFLKSTLPGNIESAREAEAYVFGSLHDAAKRGVPMTGLKPSFTRFVTMLTKFTRRMGNSLRGDGFNSPDDVFGRVVEGDAGRFAGEVAPEFRSGEEFSARLPSGNQFFDLNTTGRKVKEFGKTTFEYRALNDGSILLDFLATDPEFLNKGEARNGMQQFVSEADASGKIIRVVPEPQNNETNFNRLVDFYRSLGFKKERGSSIMSRAPMGGEEFSARTLPKISAAHQNAIDKVTGTYGQEPDSLFRKALDALTGARAKYTMLYGGDKPQRVKASDSLVMSSVNQFHAGHLADQLLKSKGRPDAAIIGRSWESANNNDARIAWMMNGSGYKFDKIRGVLVRDPKVKSIKDMFANKVPTDEAGQKRFQTYAVANLERDLRKQGKKGFLNLTDAEVASVIQESERSFPQWKEVIKDLNNWNNSLLQLLVDAGNIDQATKDKLMQVFYTPLYRKMEDDAYHNADMVMGPATAGTFKNPSDALKKREGGEEPIGDLFENIVRNADAIVKSALKNVAMENTAKGMEIAGLAEKVPARLDGAKNIMTLRRDGKDVHYRVDDPLMMIAISTAPMQIQNGFYKAMASISGIIRDMITLAPPFMLANLWRGKQLSYVQEAVPLWRSTIFGMKDALKQTTSMTSIGDVSGFGGYTWGQGSRDVVSELKRQVRLADGTASMLDRSKSIVQGLRRWGEAAEFAERVKVVNHLISKGVNPDDAAFQGYLLAPFSRRGMGTGFFGSIVSFMAPIVPFLNAKIQGTYRLLENEKKLPARKLAMQLMARGAVVTMFSMALAALASDDERWNDEPVERKMLYDIFYVGDKTILLPRAFEVGTWFGAIPVMLFDAARKEHGGDLGKAFAFALTNTLGFSPIPASVAPLITVGTNYDFFMGRELESAGMRSRPASERSQEDTSRVAEGVAYAINNTLGELPRGMRTELSPIQVQALLQGYLGTAGTMVLSAVDGFLGWSGMTPGKPAGPLGDPNSLAGIATTLTGVRRFIKGDEEKVSRFVGDFYDLKREVTQWTTAMNDARLAGDMARANEIASERSDLFSLKKQVDKASRDVNEISRRMRAIQNNPNMDPQEKADALVPLRQRRNQITGTIMEQAMDRGVR